MSPLPGSGPISLNDVQTEFGGSNPIGIDEYYATASGVPSSGTISLANFYGTAAARGLFGGGQAGGPGTSNVIEYIQIATTGNATDFGDLSEARERLAACSSSTRGIFGGGDRTAAVAGGESNRIDYVTIASTGNAQDFGDLTQFRASVHACSSSTRGLFAGGSTPGIVNVIDYITIASTGNATDFGDLTVARSGLAGFSSPTRGVFSGGEGTPVGRVNIIDYVTIASTGNAIDFGDLTVVRTVTSGCSNSTRGLIAGGRGVSLTQYASIDYVTIASVGNATNFGNLLGTVESHAGCSSSQRGVFGGGKFIAGPTFYALNTIQYVTIATTGNATDFGDFSSAREVLAACSNAHGGVT